MYNKKRKKIHKKNKYYLFYIKTLNFTPKKKQKIIQKK